MKTETPSPQPANDANTAAKRAGLRGLVHNLIAFGQALLLTLRSAPAAGVVSVIASRFGTADMALIIARITRGLMLAAGLDARLLRGTARRNPPASLGMPTTAARRSRPARAPAPPGPAGDDAALLARLPTAREIAARLRGRPTGMVLEQICHDLGITCDHPLWRALQHAIIANGGNLTRVFNAMFQRVAAGYDPAADHTTALPYPRSGPFVTAVATGPP